MQNSAKSMYALSLEQSAQAIKVIGNKTTVLLQGDMGNGKSAIGYMLDAELPNHTYFYCDCTTKDLGDLMIPKFKELDGSDCVRFATNEELGLHVKNNPIILNLDELGKANPSVKNAVLRVIYERKMGSYTMHPDSIVFATTNKGSEGVGDLLPPHARNRMTVVQLRKSTNTEWLAWGLNNDIDPSILSWVKDTPQLFHSFEDVKEPDDNPYIFHPNQQRSAFVTPRSLETASNWVKQRDKLDSNTLTMALMGTIGDRGALDLMAYIKLMDQMPSRDDIKNNPQTAKIPSSVSATVMVVFRSVASMTKDFIDPFMEYLARLDAEAQAMFANGVRHPKYQHQSIVMTNAKFTDWAMKNQHLYQADKK
tara:strand:+ start:2977 stop:4074 length:1098 start_codon:yes stop_codon:yes gene_type:complete